VIGLVAYLACVIALAALACGHQGESWPLRGVWRVLAPSRGVVAVLPAVHGPGGAPDVREAHTATEPPARPSWAHIDTEEAA
jgi:hypothetical protein